MAVLSLLTLYMACTPCTASRSHAAWDVDRRRRLECALGQAQGRKSQRPSASRFRWFWLTLDGLVEVGEVAEIIVSLTA